jgi:calcineurin-like phosphoesterase family protein
MRSGHDTNVEGYSARIPGRLGAVPGNINANTSAQTKTSGFNEMNKEIIDEYERMVRERDKLYILMLNTKKGSGARMMRDELYLLEANISKYMWVHGFTDDFRHDL